MDYVNEYDISNGDETIILRRQESFKEKVSVQIDTDGTFDGTTSTVQLLQSNDRDLDLAKWHPLPEAALTLLLNDSSLLSTFSFTAKFIAVKIVQGDATAGILSLSEKFKN